MSPILGHLEPVGIFLLLHPPHLPKVFRLATDSDIEQLMREKEGPVYFRTWGSAG